VCDKRNNSQLAGQQFPSVRTTVRWSQATVDNCCTASCLVFLLHAAMLYCTTESLGTCCAVLLTYLLTYLLHYLLTYCDGVLL